MNRSALSIPNTLTSCNLGAGLIAIHLSFHQNTGYACLMVLAAAIFDGLDGWAARLLGQESGFGKIFDSAADLVSFGFAPVFIYYCRGGGTKAILPFLLIYLLASTIRLVRFNATGPKRSSRHGNSFEGLPTTASAVLLTFPVMLFPQAAGKPGFYMPALLVLSALMLSRISFWKLAR